MVKASHNIRGTYPKISLHFWMIQTMFTNSFMKVGNPVGTPHPLWENSHFCGPFEKMSFRFVIVSSLRPHRDITKIKYLALNQGQKIHVLSSQCSCVSVFNLRDLRMISLDPACFSDFKTPPTLKNVLFQS